MLDQTAGRHEDLDEWQLAIQREYGSTEGYEVFTSTRIERARAGPVASLGDEYVMCVAWMRELSYEPARVKPELLSQFVGELGRLASNLGQPRNMDDVRAALEAAIAAQTTAGGPVSALHLAMASYLGTISTESPERARAIDAAVRAAAPGSDDWGAAMIARCAYEVLASRYKRAVRTARAVRAAVAHGLNPVFECGALTHEGTVLFSSFQDLAQAERLLTEAWNRFAELADSDVRVARWLATAVHYLGRIAEAQGRDAEALSLYLRGKEYQDRCPEEIEANAFQQLRLSEPLGNANLFDLAYDHLREARRLATVGAHVGSVGVQVDLGYASLKAKQGDLAGAERDGRAVLRRCRRIVFHRGVLLSLGFLFTVRVKRRHYLAAAGTLLRILPTLLTGELRRNSIVRLRTGIPILFRLAFRRVSRTSAVPADVTPLTGCPCPLHGRRQPVPPTDRTSIPT